MLGNEFWLRIDNGAWKLDGDGPAGFRLIKGAYWDAGALMGPVQAALVPLGLELETLRLDDGRAHVVFRRAEGHK